MAIKTEIKLNVTPDADQVNGLMKAFIAQARDKHPGCYIRHVLTDGTGQVVEGHQLIPAGDFSQANSVSVHLIAAAGAAELASFAFEKSGRHLRILADEDIMARLHPAFEANFGLNTPLGL